MFAHHVLVLHKVRYLELIINSGSYLALLHSASLVTADFEISCAVIFVLRAFNDFEVSYRLEIGIAIIRVIWNPIPRSRLALLGA